jgi:hypothetical protein
MKRSKRTKRSPAEALAVEKRRRAAKAPPARAKAARAEAPPKAKRPRKDATAVARKRRRTLPVKAPARAKPMRRTRPAASRAVTRKDGRTPISRSVAPPTSDTAAVERELRRLRRARSRLERQLTAAVQEIGILRQYEWRTAALEKEVRRRDDEIARLRDQRRGDGSPGDGNRGAPRPN